MIDLLSLVARPLTAGEAGGVRIQYQGLLGEVNVTAGLENRKEGYSATVPFWQAPMAEMMAAVSTVSIAHPGIMVGRADPMLGFPAGTQFQPYLALRNLTDRMKEVNLTLYTEQGTPLKVPALWLHPLESRQLDLGDALLQLGLKDLNGPLTLLVSHPGGVTDIMSVAGSVDSKGTYVFEVDGRAAEQKVSKQTPYWSVENGNDTMVALWNPSDNAEEVTVTLNYARGSGRYHFHVHLAPHATANLDVKELIANQSRDEEGNLLPLDLQEGSFVFRDAKDVYETTSISVNIGIYNVIKGTCYYGTVWCDGYTGLLLTPSCFVTLPGSGQQLTARGQYSNGTTPGVTAEDWASSNTSLATVGSSGLVTGVGGGAATISASAVLPAYGEWSGYNPSCAALQTDQNFTGHSTVTVQQPTSSRIVQTTQNSALAAGQNPCSAGQAGWIRVVTKIVTDQSGSDMVYASQSLTEKVTLSTPNALKVSGVVTGTATTNAQGLFSYTLYVCSSVCPQSTGTATASQTITDTAIGHSYNLSSNTFTYSCTGNKINGQ